MSLPPIVVRALDMIDGFGPGNCLPIDEIRFPRDALCQLRRSPSRFRLFVSNKRMLHSVPLAANRHNSTMRAVLYRGEWQADHTYGVAK
jgi:hypothetical protein